MIHPSVIQKKWFWRELTEWTVLDFRRENYHKLDLMDILGSHDPMIILVNRSPLKMGVSPLVNIQKIWEISIFNGKIHYKWPCSIAMLVYQRVMTEGWDLLGIHQIRPKDSVTEPDVGLRSLSLALVVPR